MCGKRLIFKWSCPLAAALALMLAGCGLKTSPDKPNPDFPRTYPVK